MSTPKRKKIQRSKRYPKQHVSDLVARARSQETSGKFPFIDEMTPEEARDELLMRFSKYTEGLVKIHITGKVNSFLDYHKSYIKLWKKKTTDDANIGQSLKRELGDRYPHDELYRVGRIAQMEALARTKTNYASTILSCMKDLFFAMIKNNNSHLTSSLNEAMVASPDEDVDFNLQLSFLSEEEQSQIREYLDYLDRGKKDLEIDGPPPELPEDLLEKLKDLYSDYA